MFDANVFLRQFQYFDWRQDDIQWLCGLLLWKRAIIRFAGKLCNAVLPLSRDVFL